MRTHASSPECMPTDDPTDLPHVAADEVRDRALVARVAAGDDGAFEQLVRLHRPRMQRIAERIVDEGRAEDAVQNALLGAYQAFRRGEAPRQPAAWLSAITRNAAIDQQRRRGPVEPVAEPQLLSVAPGADDVAAERAEIRRVLADVAALPPNEREALLLRAVSGAGHETISEQLHVSSGQARQLLFRARRRLREVAAVLLPGWLALRLSQGRAQAAGALVGGAEPLLAAKTVAVSVAAVAAIGTGGAALTTLDVSAPSAPPAQAAASSAGAAASPSSSTGAAGAGTSVPASRTDTRSDDGATKTRSETRTDDDETRTRSRTESADSRTETTTRNASAEESRSRTETRTQSGGTERRTKSETKSTSDGMTRTRTETRDDASDTRTRTETKTDSDGDTRTESSTSAGSAEDSSGSGVSSDDDDRPGDD